MCGIAGIVNFDQSPIETAALRRMISTLVHRGPDGEGLWIEGMAGFAHRRLAIRGLGEHGHQPMVDSSGQVVVTYNGEIYNDLALRRELQRDYGVVYRGTCDTETIGPAWLAWGLNCLDRFEGMFAFALWDRVQKRLVLARDNAGIKPLFYAWTGRSLRFASELKALLALPDLDRRLSPEDIHRFLAQGHAGPTRTLVHGIRQVPPGTALVVDMDGERLEQFWTPRRTGSLRRMDDALAAFEPLWRSVVTDHLISDVPAGLLLSGGIDSTLVAAGLGAGGPAAARPIAFTARFSDPSYDETAVALATATAAGLEHRTETVDETHDPLGLFRRVVHHLDGQFADSTALALYGICGAARRHVPVLLSGDGADEFFGGYETYRASRLAGLAGSLLPRSLAIKAGDWLERWGAGDESRVPTSEKLARFLTGIALGGAMPHCQWRRYLPARAMATLYGPALSGLDSSVDPLADYVAAAGKTGTLVDRCLLADQRYYLPGAMLLMSDAMSMAHGLELRVPFLDRRIMALAGDIDARLLTPLGGPDKALLRRAVARAGIGGRVATLPKRGFNIPIAALLRGALAPLGNRLLDHDADLLAPYFSPDGLRRLWRAHRERKANHAYALWSLLTLATWQETVN